ncbi:hypothetical protein ACFXGI_24060 [Streptomyces sp. NPDC059355]|uniref:hypothetical protein n=1 Tax=Streptomyces sp. NPDC059355 TaxID=3346811 RepID=UPI00367ECE57
MGEPEKLDELLGAGAGVGLDEAGTVRGGDELGAGGPVAVSGEVEDPAHEGPYGRGGVGGEGDGQLVPGGGGGGRPRPWDPAGPAEDAVAATAGEGPGRRARALRVLLDEEVGDLGVVVDGGLRLGRSGHRPHPSPSKPDRGLTTQGKPMRAARKESGAAAADGGDGPGGV